MGTGKTTIGAAAAHLAGFRSVLVLCPPHLVRKWQREIVATVPLAKTAIVTSVSDLNQLRRPDGAPLYAITLATGGISSLGVWLMYRASRSADADARGVFNDFIAEHTTGPTRDTYTFETRDAADGSEHDNSGLDHDDETAFDNGG